MAIDLFYTYPLKTRELSVYRIINTTNSENQLGSKFVSMLKSNFCCVNPNLDSKIKLIINALSSKPFSTSLVFLPSNYKQTKRTPIS